MARTICARVFVCVLLLSCSSAPARQRGPLVRVPVGVHSGIVFVPVTIDGKGPFSFVLDSGFENCVIERTLATSHHLEVGPKEQAAAPGGAIELATINGAHLAVAGIEIDTPTILALDLKQFAPFFGHAPDGILGYDFFRSYVVEVDYEKRRLALFDPATFTAPANASTLPIDTASRQPYVTATVVSSDGRRSTGRFEIDTGSMDALCLNTPFARANAIASGTAGLTARGRSLGGETQAVLMRVGALELGGITLPAPIAGVVEDAVNRAGQISGETLRRFTVTFDYSRNLLHLAKNTGFSSPFDLDMAGWLIVASGPKLDGREVFLVFDHSPAALAGVKVGDALIRVDGRPVASLTLDALRSLFKMPGKTFQLELNRAGVSHMVTIKTKRLL
jgi:Aspartyl protease/PDZ domain